MSDERREPGIKNRNGLILILPRCTDDLQAFASCFFYTSVRDQYEQKNTADPPPAAENAAGGGSAIWRINILFIFALCNLTWI